MAEISGFDAEMEARLAVDRDEEAGRAAKRKAERRDLIDRWNDNLRRARKHDRQARARWADDRRVARGETEWLVDTNLIGAILEVLAAFLYARNPDVSVRPSPSVNRKMLKEFRALGETLEVMVSRLLRDAGLKRIGKRWVRGAMTVGIAWIKAGMQTRAKRDPLFGQELNDLQQNLERLVALQKRLADGESVEEEIRSVLTSMQSAAERKVAEGVVLDIMAPEDVVIAPEVGEIENYRHAPWIAFDLYKSRDEALQITGWSLDRLKQGNVFTQRPRKGEDEEDSKSQQWVQLDDEGAESAEGFFRFTEIWSLTNGVVYTLVDGISEDWARPPYAPRTGRRFYPCFALYFHPIDGERWPQSDVFQLKRLGEEYARTRSNFAEHRRRAVPGVLVDDQAIDKDSVDRITRSEVQEFTPVHTVRPGINMPNAFFSKPYAPVDLNLYNTDQITQEMEKVSGAQDAVQGAIRVEKTATEAQILESGRGARTGARLDTLEESLNELAEYTMQLVLLTMDRSDAIRYAGPESVWIEMSTEEALTMFSLEIKAGSTGKPKANSDREAWGTLMPLIEQMIDRIGHARMQGQEWAAKPWIALLIESFNRLDDHADIEKFLPVPPPEVVQAMTRQEPSRIETSERLNEDADTLKKLAETLEKQPLFMTPALSILKQMNGGSAAKPAEPAPNLLPNEIN